MSDESRRLTDCTAYVVLYAGGAAIVAASTWLAFSLGPPECWAPTPLLTLALYWNLGPTMAFGYAPILYLAASMHLAVGRSRIPVHSTLIFNVLVATSFFSYIFGWPLGVEYQGTSYMVTVTIINTSIITALVSLLLQNRKRSSFFSSYAFHVLLFSWLASYWIPYMGEPM